MTTTTSPSEWFHQFYQPNPTPASILGAGGRPSDATVVSTTSTTNYSLSQLGLGGLGSGSGSGSDLFLGSSNSPTSPSTVTTTTTTTTTTVSGRLSPAQEGRVSRPARRRSRASRRNPTTLLNTDTTNFRAMVQRYTGGASSFSPFDSPAGFNLPGSLNPGPMYNFNQHGSVVPGAGMHYLSVSRSPPASSTGVNPQASHLHQQLLQQYGVALSSTGSINASSMAVGHRGLGLEEEGVSSLSHVGPRAGLGSDHYSSAMGGNGARW